LKRVAPLLLLAAGCGIAPGGEPVESRSEAIVYGTDDRQEVFETDDPVLRALAEEVTVALMRRSDVELGADGMARIVAPSWQEAGGLCPGQRFAAQPAAAFCTGTLVADGLVVTAGHCLDAVPCADLVAVFGYHNVAADQLRPIPNGDVVACGELIAKQVDLPSSAVRVDYAWFRLATPRPAPYAIEIDDRGVPLELEAAVQTVTFGAGIPAKIDRSGRVRNARAATLDYFVTNLDAFHGASGAAVYDASHRMVGVLGRGGTDLLSTDGDCNVAFREIDEPEAAQEQVTYAFRAVDGLCDSDNPEPGLCPDVPGAPGGCSVARRRADGRAAWVALFLAAIVTVKRRRDRQCDRKGAPS
jgi:trypsin-like peptidase